MDDKIERKKCFFWGVGLGCGCVYAFLFLQFLNLVTADGRVSSGDLFPSVSLVIKWAIVLIRVTMDTTVKVAASTFKSSQTKLLLTDATLLLLLLRRR